MELKQAIGILETHNRWRRGEDSEPMLIPKDIGIAIDIVVEHIKNNALHSIVERLNNLPIYQIEPKRDYSDCWLDIWELGKNDEDAEWIKIDDVKKIIKELENSL